MKILEPLFQEMIENLNRFQIEYLLIGGYAVNYYGFGRYTGDIDFWLNPDPMNKNKFIGMLEALAYNQDGVEQIKSMDFGVAQVISIGVPPTKIDFLTKVNLVSFEEAWPSRKFFPLKHYKIPVVDYQHLIIMKINTGRLKDQLDIEELQKINSNKNIP
jgi:hypothetical protein